MQKILEQDLSGSENEALLKVEYTWQKDEIAYFFDTNYCDVFKVRFTGDNWLSGNKWSRKKIYKFKYLESSGDHEFKTRGSDVNHRYSHTEEDKFYTNKKEALERGFKYIEAIKNDALKTFESNKIRLNLYELKDNENGSNV